MCARAHVCVCVQGLYRPRMSVCVYMFVSEYELGLIWAFIQEISLNLSVPWFNSCSIISVV